MQSASSSYWSKMSNEQKLKLANFFVQMACRRMELERKEAKAIEGFADRGSKSARENR